MLYMTRESYQTRYVSIEYYNYYYSEVYGATCQSANQVAACIVIPTSCWGSYRYARSYLMGGQTDFQSLWRKQSARWTSPGLLMVITFIGMISKCTCVSK